MDVVREVWVVESFRLIDYDVSILVLMDVVREVSAFKTLCAALRGFNPCSNGCRSGRPPPNDAGLPPKPFQSLF